MDTFCVWTKRHGRQGRLGSVGTTHDKISPLVENQPFHRHEGFAHRHAGFQVPGVDHFHGKRAVFFADSHTAGGIDFIHSQPDSPFRIPAVQIRR